MKQKVFAILAFALAFGGCNKTPPNVTPLGASAFRIQQVVVAIDTIGEVAVKAEKSGFIEHKDTLKVAEVVSRSSYAAADLGRAFRAGEGAEARAKTIAIIRKALEELPGNLDPKAREAVEPYVSVALTLLALVG